jgi:acid phosphatase
MHNTKLVLACSACLVIGWAVGQRNVTAVRAEPAPAKAPPLPQAARLGGALYMASGEYRACCTQVYRCALRRLDEFLKSARPAAPAVVMDLDETVLDNSAFQTFLFQNNLEYSDELWAEFEKNHPQDVALVPGARDFILGAGAMGVRVIFVSNRFDANGTEAALRRLGLGLALDGGGLYLRAEKGPTDKSARREAVAAKYNVVMFFGDNLRDFSEAFAAKRPPADAPIEAHRQAIAGRDAAVDQASCHWGIDWFVLPNPVYGEWEKLLGPRPVEVLRPTSMARP